MGLFDWLTGKRGEPSEADKALAVARSHVDRLTAELRESEEEKGTILDGQTISDALDVLGATPGKRVKEPAQAYAWHVWSFACALRTGQAVGAVKIVGQGRAGLKGKREEAPLSTLTARSEFVKANPNTSLYEHVVTITIDKLLSGQSYELVLDDGLWRADPRRITIIPDKSRARVKAYRFDLGMGTYKDLPPDVVIHTKFPNPLDPWYGLGPGGVALDDVKLDQQMQDYNAAYFQHGARLSMVLETDQELSRTARRKMVREFLMLHGGAKKAGGVAALSKGLKAREMGETHRELEFHEGRLDVRDRVLTAYGVPPVLVGITESVNYANALQQLRIFYEFQIKPLLTMTESGWNDNRVLFPVPEKSRVEFDRAEIDRMLIDPLVAAQAGEVLARSKLFGRNKIRDMVFHQPPMDPLEELDVLEPAPAPNPFGGAFGQPPPPKPPAPPPEPPKDPDEAEAGAQRTRGRRRASRTASDDEDAPVVYRRHAAWKTDGWDDYLIRAQDDAADTFRDMVIERFHEQRVAILARIPASTEQSFERAQVGVTLDDLLEALRANRRDFAEDAADEVLDVIDEVGRETFGRLGLDPDAFETDDPESIEFAARHGFRMVDDINATTEAKLRTLHATALDEGWSPRTLANAIESAFDQWEGEDGADIDATRAMRIARTETVAAQNYGTLAGFRESGIVGGKTWHSLGDFKVRDSHAEVNATTVALDERFSNGLLYPGDMDAGLPGEVVNCRCGMEPAEVDEA